MKRITSTVLVLSFIFNLLIQTGQFVTTVHADSPNLALGAVTLDASSAKSGGTYPVEKVVDGDSSTGWQPNSADRPNGSVWYSLDLGQQMTYNKAIFKFGTNIGLGELEIAYSNDALTWSTAYKKAVENKGNNTLTTETVTFNEVSGRYVKVIFTLTDTTKNLNVREFELYDEEAEESEVPEEDNLALHANVLAFSSGSSNPVSNALDGHNGTFWAPTSIDRANGPYFILDLGSSKKINRALFNFRVNNSLGSYTIQYSDNAIDWIEAYAGSPINRNNTPGDDNKIDTVDFANVVDARYVKVILSFNQLIESGIPIWTNTGNIKIAGDSTCAGAVPCFIYTNNFQLNEFQLYKYTPPVQPATKPASVTAAYSISDNGSVGIGWKDPLLNANDPAYDHIVVTLDSDPSNPVIVAKGNQFVSFNQLNNGQEYTFTIQTVTQNVGGDVLSDAVTVSAIPKDSLNTLLIHAGKLDIIKNDLLNPLNTNHVEAVNELIELADLALEADLYSVMNKTGMTPSGDKHDYWSIAPYWWPDPTKPNGLPYINRDGVTNPDGNTNMYDKQNFIDFKTVVLNLSLAYYVTNDEQYAERAAEQIRSWFLNPATKMNPNFNYGQGIRGSVEGRAQGILEANKLLDLIDAVELISNSTHWSIEDTKGFKSWLAEFTEWLTTNPLAIAEKNTHNNHGTWYDTQFVAYTTYLGYFDEARAYINSIAIPRIEEQILEDGTMPEELRRTRPFHYFIYNLIPITMTAMIGDYLSENVWGGEEGRIHNAYQFITPYIVDFASWPYKELNAEDERNFVTYLRTAAMKFNQNSYWSAAEILLADQMLTHRANLVAPGGIIPATRQEMVAFRLQDFATPVIGTIDETNSSITLRVPKGTDVTRLRATFASTGETVKIGATNQVSGVSVNDYTLPVVYTVVSPLGQTKNYTVYVNVSSTRLPQVIYETSFTEYRSNPIIDTTLAQNSSITLFDIIAPLPQLSSNIEANTWYQGFMDNGILRAGANIFIKDGNSTHTRSIPAALRLLKNTTYGSMVTLNVSTSHYEDIVVSFVARTQDQSLNYKLHSEWSVDGGVTWTTADTLIRDSDTSILTNTYNKVPFTVTISDPGASDASNFLFRFRLDKTSSGYMNLDDIQFAAVPKETNASLYQLDISNGILSPAFHPSVTEYTVDVDHNVTHISFNPIFADAAAKIEINGLANASFTPFNIQVGQNEFLLKVTPEVGNSKTYKVTVNRAPSL